MKAQGIWSWCAVCWVLLLLVGTQVVVGTDLNPADPMGFFTTLASRLLKSEMNLDLQHLQIYPTNQYTPAVQRLLQVSANIYEATTNRFLDDYPHLPTVFRPRFTNQAGSVFICGYVEQTNAPVIWRLPRDPTDSNSMALVQPDDFIFGVPPVIGVKKGLPNFNEFSCESVFQMTRNLELLKSAPGGGDKIYQTNQMLIVGISNVFGAEFWNPCWTNYPRAVVISVTNYFGAALTNDLGFVFTTNIIACGRTILTATNCWPSWRGGLADTSFVVPLRSNHVTIPDSVYQMESNYLVVPAQDFERPSGFAFPRWGLTIKNCVYASIVETDSGRVVDFVLLGGMNGHRDLSDEMATTNNPSSEFNHLWATNSLDGMTLSDQLGVVNQIQISKGDDYQHGNWQHYALSAALGPTRYEEIAYFKAFFSANNQASVTDDFGNIHSAINNDPTAYTPFNPTWKASMYFRWQANDPLLHYMKEDLWDMQKPPALDVWLPPNRTNSTLANLGKVNERYRPWGGNPIKTGDSGTQDASAFNLLLKDPLIWSSAKWSFPDSQPLSLLMLGQVHRGTPWQTLYLKSGVPEPSAWQNWTGNPDPSDAAHTLPNRDWDLLALLTTLVSTSSPTALLSVNEPDSNAWRRAFNGLVTLTNSASDEYVLDNAATIIDPLPLDTNSVQVANLIEAIRLLRQSQPDERFDGLGSILAVAELSVVSPFLNHGSTDVDGHNIQLESGISDEAYERIPVQLLPRLRMDSIGAAAAQDGGVKIQFSGIDALAYTVQVSSNLVDWINVATNHPTNGVFSVLESTKPEVLRFYRSVLMP